MLLSRLRLNFSSWDVACGSTLISSFEMFRHGSRDPLFVRLDASLAVLSLAHGFCDPLAALSAVLLSPPCLPVLDDILALRAVSVEPVLLQVLTVDAQLSCCLWRGGLCGGPAIVRPILECYALTLLSCLDVTRHCADFGQLVSAPPVTLMDPCDRPCSNHTSVREAHCECVVVSVVPHEHPLASLWPDIALRVVVRSFDRMLVEHVLPDADDWLAERSSSHTFPRREPVCTSDYGIEQ